MPLDELKRLNKLAESTKSLSYLEWVHERQTQRMQTRSEWYVDPRRDYRSSVNNLSSLRTKLWLNAVLLHFLILFLLWLFFQYRLAVNFVVCIYICFISFVLVDFSVRSNFVLMIGSEFCFIRPAF